MSDWLNGRRVVSGWFGILLVAGLSAPALAEEPAHDFIGVKKCSMCHRTPKIGEQFQKWEASAHAKAFEVLGTPAAAEVASAQGIDDPQTSGQCLQCHSTAYGFTEEQVTSAVPVEEGVSCESCHGPGKDYMSMTVMKDRDKAIAAGLIIPDAETCTRCHSDRAPHDMPPFDFDKNSEKISHPIPE